MKQFHEGVIQNGDIWATKEMKTDKKGTCVYEKDIHISNKGQGAATNREKGQGITLVLIIKP